MPLNIAHKTLKNICATTAICGTLIGGVSPAFASGSVTTNFSGTLDNSQQYVRPGSVGGAAPWAAGATTYNYFTESFTPGGSGNFDIEVLSTSTIADPVLYLYSDSFDPNNPNTNGIIANDDGGVGLMPLISGQALVGDTTYVIVVTSFSAGDSGTFNFEIVGPFGIAVGGPNYVDTASPTGATSIAQYFDNNDDSGDRQVVAVHLNTLNEAELVTALKTLLPVNSGTNAQSFVNSDSKSTSTLLNKIGTVLGSSSSTLQDLSVSGQNRDYSDWIFGHRKSGEEAALDPTLSLASGTYDKFEAGSQGMWGEVVVADTNGDGSSNSLGYDGLSRGLVMGFEHALSKSLMVGVLAGYYHSNVDLDSNAGETTADNYNLGLYAQKLIDGVKLSGVVLMGYGEYDAERLINLGGITETPSADYSSKSVSGTLNISKLFTHETIRIEPFASVSATGAWVDSYTETGGGAFNTHVDNDSFSYAGVKLGITFEKRFKFEDDSALNLKLTPYGGHDWEIDGSNTSVNLVGGTGSTVINGQSLTTYKAGIGGEISYDFTPATSAKAGFDYSHTETENRLLGFVGFGVKF